MFQKLKGAIDRGIAEEQERQRAARQPRSTTASRTSGSQNASSKVSRQGIRGSEDDAANLTGPDPNPATFEPEFVVGDDDASSRAITPRPPEEAAEAAGNDGPAETASSQSRPSAEGSATSELPPRVTSPDVSVDAQVKLRRLAKLESKYQELLRAYRKAHARNSAIEPFEARLRENTPLTTINDPDALVEYLNQLTVKSDMAMNELKKVSGEKDSIKQKLDEAENKAREAYDEVSRLKKDRDEKPVVDAEDGDESDSGAGKVQDSSSSNIELSRLEEELRHRGNRIDELEAQIQEKADVLESANRSKDEAMTALESSKAHLKVLQDEKDNSQIDLEKRCAEAEMNGENLQGQLKKAESELESHKSKFHEQQTTSEKLQRDLDGAKEELRNVKSPANVPESNITTTSSVTGTAAADTANSAAKKKKNKKKKKGANSTTTGNEVQAPEADQTEETQEPGESTESASAEILQLQSQITDRDATIDQLNSKVKDQDDLREEIENLKDELINVGQEHVEVKDKLKQVQTEKDNLQASLNRLDEEAKKGNPDEVEGLKSKVEALEAEKVALTESIKKLEEQVAQAEITQGEIIKVRTERDSLERSKAELETQLEELHAGQLSKESASENSTASLRTELDDLKVRAQTLQTDLSAAQHLATSRFKDLSKLRERFHRVQPELVSLRAEAEEVKALKEEQTIKSADLRRLEVKTRELRSEIESQQTELTERDNEIRSINRKYNEEFKQRESLEDELRKLRRETNGTQRDMTEALAAKDDALQNLQKTQKDLEQSQTKANELQDQAKQLNGEVEGLRDEIALKSAQYASAQSLMSNSQDQATEMATQMREVKERCESLEDELTGVHRLLDGRSREAEKMRRLLTDVDGRAESKVKDMREKLNNAIEERNRAEDDANTSGRRRARELEELRSKLRRAEHDLSEALEGKTELERLKTELEQNSDGKESRVSEVTQELEEARRAMSNLRTILEDSEAQIKDLEVERAALKRSSDELQERLNKLQSSNKQLADDLRSIKVTRLRPSDSPAQSSRSSLDSTSQVSRIMSPTALDRNLTRAGSSSNGGVGGGSGVDYVYLKNVLLQFVEQKDRKYQLQLVPVLGKLLHFDKKDEQKWNAAITAK